MHNDDLTFDVPTDTSRPETEEEARRKALENPGPSWSEWLYSTALKWWLGIGFLIVDSWIVTTFLEVGAWVFLVLATVAAVYCEYLVYRYLWARPEEIRRGAHPRRRWPPFQVGRWTPEGRRARQTGITPTANPATKDPREFL
jgi:hypothetical protein